MSSIRLKGILTNSECSVYSENLLSLGVSLVKSGSPHFDEIVKVYLGLNCEDFIQNSNSSIFSNKIWHN